MSSKKHILPFADAKFFPIIRRLAKHMRRFAQYRLHVYALGMNERQKRHLADGGVAILRTEFPVDALSMNIRGQIRATHKMYCIEHFIRLHGKPVLVLDADTLIIENIDELWPKTADSIVVTARHQRERTPHIVTNGLINAGVMAFGADSSAEFFRQWKEKCIQDANAADQSALSDMLVEENIDFAKLNVRQPRCWGSAIVRDSEIYNGVTCRTGKIFRFKSIARLPRKLAIYKLFSAIYAVFPRMVEALVRYNRKYRLYVWEKTGVKKLT